MTKDYISPELEVVCYRMNESIFTSEPGPPDLDNGEELDPDNNGGIDANGYFAD